MGFVHGKDHSLIMGNPTDVCNKQKSDYDIRVHTMLQIQTCSLQSQKWRICDLQRKKKSLVIVRSHDQLCISKAKSVRFLIGI